jgi:hypothetical protein
MKKNKSKISKLEKEFEKKLEDHIKPDHKTWTTYKKFINDINKTKIKKDNPQVVDKLTRQLNKDVEKAQKEEQKRLLKEIKKLSKELGMKKEFEKLKNANQEVKQSEKYLKDVKKNKNVKAFYEKKYTLQFEEKSKFYMKKVNGEIFNFIPTVNIDVNDNTIDLISERVFDLYTNIYKKFRRIYNQGFEIKIKITFLNGLDDNGLISITLKDDPTIEHIRKLISEKIVNKFIGGDSEFSAILNELTIFVFPLSIKGGCATCKKNVQRMKFDTRKVKLISPKSSNDNCLFMCFAHFLNIKGNTLRFNEIRKELNLNEEGMIEYTNVHKIADYFKTGFVLLDQK